MIYLECATELLIKVFVAVVNAVVHFVLFLSLFVEYDDYLNCNNFDGDYRRM